MADRRGPLLGGGSWDGPHTSEQRELSTTGAPSKTKVARGVTVVLVPAAAASARGVPELRLGGDSPSVAHAGSDAGRCEATLPEDVGAAPLQCQFALRSFAVQGTQEAQEALFLRDVSETDRPTLVNGSPAYRPWHWLHKGDEVALSVGTKKSMRGRGGDSEQAASLWHIYRVDYCEHVPFLWPSAPAVAPGAGRDRTASGADAQQRDCASFGREVIGKVIDVTYEDPEATYRVRVIEFDPDTGWHNVNSHGYSKWVEGAEDACAQSDSGESFVDELDLGSFYQQGRVAFVDGDTAGASSDDCDLPLSALVNRKRARS